MPASTLIAPASAVTIDSKYAFFSLVVHAAVVVKVKFPSEGDPGATTTYLNNMLHATADLGLVRSDHQLCRPDLNESQH